MVVASIMCRDNENVTPSWRSGFTSAVDSSSGLVVRIPGSHPGGPGSIPGVGNPFWTPGIEYIFGNVKIVFFSCWWRPEVEKILRRPGIEPGSTAWKAAMLTIIPQRLWEKDFDPDRIRTRSLLIWSQTRYRCATESSCVRSYRDLNSDRWIQSPEC